MIKLILIDVNLEILGGFIVKKRGFIEEDKIRNRHLSGLDGMRAIACLLVIFHHIVQRLSMEITTGNSKEIQSFFVFVANSGTSIFFVLSGFLLSYPFWKRYLENKDMPSIKEYTVKRAARIIPGFYVALIVSVIITLVLKIDSEYFWKRTIAAFTFTSGFSYKTFFPSDISAPLWSISLEVFWYILLPVFMIILFKISKKRNLLKGVAFWIGVIFLVCIVNKYIHTYFTPDDFQKGWQFGNVGGAKLWMPNYNPIALFAQFIFGVLASGITIGISKLEHKISYIKNVGFFDLLGILSIIAAVMLLWNFRYEPEFSHSIQNQPYFFPVFQILIGIILISLCHSKFLGRIMDNPIFKYTSKVSFGLYMWHSIIITLVTYLWVPNYIYGGIYNIKQWLIISIGIIIASYIVASISYFLIERPIMNKANKCLKKKQDEVRDFSRAIRKIYE